MKTEVTPTMKTEVTEKPKEEVVENETPNYRPKWYNPVIIHQYTMTELILTATTVIMTLITTITVCTTWWNRRKRRRNAEDEDEATFPAEAGNDPELEGTTDQPIVRLTIWKRIRHTITAIRPTPISNHGRTGRSKVKCDGRPKDKERSEMKEMTAKPADSTTPTTNIPRPEPFNPSYETLRQVGQTPCASCQTEFHPLKSCPFQPSAPLLPKDTRVQFGPNRTRYFTTASPQNTDVIIHQKRDTSDESDDSSSSDSSDSSLASMAGPEHQFNLNEIHDKIKKKEIEAKEKRREERRAMAERETTAAPLLVRILTTKDMKAQLDTRRRRPRK